ncbi:MAG: hypothetical protein Q7S27_03445 [Nanoarchaeota archaeon]|nr:hypothetical protein [Nanoarchaeota archaeon]
MEKQRNSQYEAILEHSVTRLKGLGVKKEKATELTRDAANQYYSNGQYHKRTGVNEDIHNVFREIVKPYATNVSNSNQRRCDLIDKEIDGTLEEGEKEELKGLQEFVMDFVHHIAPLPIKEAKILYEQLRQKGR